MVSLAGSLGRIWDAKKHIVFAGKSGSSETFIVKGAYPHSGPKFFVVVSFIYKYFNENYFTIFLLEQNKGFWEIVALGRAFWW